MFDVKLVLSGFVTHTAQEYLPFKQTCAIRQFAEPTIFELVAQLAVQEALNLKAVGSLPTEFTKFASLVYNLCLGPPSQ